jgi:SpoVK/Ycf46/Vps4 family AAA+-type ATPase
MKKTNMVVTCLDNHKNQNTYKNNICSYENSYYNDYYNSPFFSGMLDIMPKLESLDDDIEKIENKIIKTPIQITEKINKLEDLIKLCDTYPLADNIEYNINMESLHKIKPNLISLQNMIGMKSIKENIVDQILYFIQELHQVSTNNSDYMHTVIYGPPGTGKTEVAKIMGKIFSNLGALKSNKFKKVTRDDLIAGYLGQTALKTKDVIKDCIGGVLFIDEAYALGNKETSDSFSKESIDTICEALSDHKNDLMCIIAGYEKELHNCFFNYNPGLKSRFTWNFHIDNYTGEELRLIFEKMVNDSNWSLKEPISDEWFDKNKELFQCYGRDMETLFSKIKIVHSKRVFCLPKDEKTKISHQDMEDGLSVYKKMSETENHRKEKERLSQLYNSLYC